MKISLKLFSSLMEYLPKDAVGNSMKLEVASATTCNDLLKKYAIPADAIQVVMLNGEFLPPEQRDAALADGDGISVWPSIQGG